MHRPRKDAHHKHAIALTEISLRYRQKPNTSGDWKPQAELVDRNLLAYTSVPSNPSFMGAFVT